jgi:triosephosphate isomerase
MLKELTSHVIVGHSERRQWFGESDDLVRVKTSTVLAAEMTPIVCVGESLETRQAGSANSFVTDQLLAVFSGRTSDEIASCVVAYEPIWAIGTGVAASAADAESMAVVIRLALDLVQPGVSAAVRVLYGGSVTPSNCAETLGQPNVDGALVGGASLNADTFLKIVRSVAR